MASAAPAPADLTGVNRSPVTIVIPAWNAVDVTGNCLSALHDTLGPDDQVVVVDNGSRDKTPELLASIDWVEVVTHEENQGFGGGCNAGARQARHPLLVFLNNDTLPAPGWIDGLVAPFGDPAVGATGPMSNVVSGPQLWHDETYRPQTIADITAHADALRRRSAGQTRQTHRLVGFCLAVRTSVFHELGGFDERFGLGGCEDDDLCNRLRFAGWRLVIAEDTFVHHVGHQTFEDNHIDWFGLQQDNVAKLRDKLESAVPLSFVVLCGAEPVPLIATLVGIEKTMGATPYEVILLIPDRAPLAEVLAGVGGVQVVDVPDRPEQRAWQVGQHAATGLRRALLRAGDAVDVTAVQRLLDSDPRQTRPTAVGAVLRREPDTRSLYLDLMQRCLLNTIYEDPAQDPWSGGRYDPAKRAGGLDWPSLAHTMIGRQRMDNLRWAVETALTRGVPGDLIETGVWRGGACIFMRAILKAYGVVDRRVFVADSFEGLPPPDPDRYPADAGDRHHTFAPLAVSLAEVRANFARYDLLDDQVVFLKGWFKDTLSRAPVERLAVLRLDGDMYESTMDALVALYHKVSPGGFVIVDDYALPGCKQAITDFRAERGIEAPLVGIDSMSVYWQV
jgi:O-methyltransferase/8-demethyl-8-(2,3-dimethoxy-alpha-L-rhamnosyl)tetracenomycin-C 4'-O-methyltransferase